MDPGGGAPCGGSGIASLGNGSGTNQGAGNPIHIITGNKYQQEVDLAPLPGVLGLEIVRHYNSVTSRGSNGILGRGWKLSYETELDARGATLEIVQADGTAIAFERVPGNPQHYRSADPADGSVSVRRTTVGDEHLWTWPNGRQLSFDAAGKLVQIAAPTGEFVSLMRDPQGWLVSVTDPQGRSLRLNYLDRRIARADRHNDQRFRGVQSIDSPVGRFGYEYGSEPAKDAAGTADEPVHRTQRLANLVKVKLPTHHDAGTKVHAYADRGVSSSSVSRVYHYEDARFPTLLTGISVIGSGSDGTLMSQRIGTYAYDGAGRGVLSVRGEPARWQGEGNGNGSGPVAGTGIEQVVFDRSRPGETVLTNSLGQTTIYRHATVAGQPRLLEVRGAGCASCGPSNVRYAYDPLGRLVGSTTLDREGRPLSERRTRLDTEGRPVRIERVDYDGGKALPPRWLLRYEYAAPRLDASGQPLGAVQPSLIARPSVIEGREHSLRIAFNDAGQPVQITEEGYSPLDENGAETRFGTPIARSIRYGYRAINGRSLLVQIDGPLPNGPEQRSVRQRHHALRVGRAGPVRRGRDGAGWFHPPRRPRRGRAHRRHARRRRCRDPIQLRRAQPADARRPHGPRLGRAEVQSLLYDALGRRVEVGSGDAATQAYRGQVRYGFDAAGRNVWTASALGVLQHRRFDSEGKTIEAGTASAGVQQLRSYRYDEFNRLIEVVGQRRPRAADRLRCARSAGSVDRRPRPGNALSLRRALAADRDHRGGERDPGRRAEHRASLRARCPGRGRRADRGQRCGHAQSAR